MPISNQSPSASQYCFTTIETAYGVPNNTAGVATVVAADAVRIAALDTSVKQETVKRDIKSGNFTPLVQIPSRPMGSWSLDTELYSNGVAGTKPDLDDLLMASFGKASVAVASTSVTYGLADHLPATPAPSLSIYNFRDPATTLQQLAIGAVVKTMTLAFNANGSQKIQFSGPCKYVLENFRFASEDTATKSSLTAFPVRPAAPVYNGAPVLGWKGSVTIGGNAYATLRSGSLTVDFNRDLLMDVLGAGLAIGISQGERAWPVDLTLYADDSASFQSLIVALTSTAQNVVIAIGNVAGNIHTFSLNNILFDRETLDSTARNWSVKIKGNASGTNLDEAGYVIT
jgi:hypothetical protein